MAYSSVRVQFEIGHEASVRTKKTPDGFTHDWEVFVKGADNTDIQYFVDKVVFYLHETFPKPRRVIKEPPYVVKESGYAGFVLPIDVYLKNKEEPKKISFQYDLTLQNSGPPISRVLREPRVFQNPSEDFRRKLVRGGGVGVETPNEVPSEDHKPSSSLGLSKSKPTESPNRKHKPELKLNDSFAELFGPPIRRITPEPKKISDLGRKVLDSDKEKKKLPKSHKEDKDAPKEKDKYADRDRVKERDKSKDKSQKPSVKPKEEHKKHEEKERKKEDSDEKKKRKEEREKKEKHKEGKELEKQEIRKEKKEPRESNDYLKKLNSSKSHENRAPEKISAELEKERSEKEKHKHRHKKKEKEKNREKERHKKEKEKNDHDSRERNREKDKFNKKRHEEGKEREKKKSRSPSPPPEKMKKGPLNALLVELGSSDSASPLSEDEDSIPSFKSASKAPAKVVPENKTTVNLSPKLKSTNFNEKDAEKHPKLEEGKTKRDKSPGKKSKKNDVDAEKRRAKEHRRRSTSTDREEEEEKLRREEAELFEKEQAEKERLLEEEKAKQSKKEKEANRKRKRERGLEQKFKKNAEAENNVSASQAESLEPQDDLRKTEKFTKEYVAQLRDLQHRIMTLEDNDYLQKVVQVIAETGQYEITKQTFDFDLCALDINTIRRLQEFFSPT
ncbi:UNVERIFIED_CONTAM: hypothetical protein PYX00_008003 [Menopon gallinae]|uniref:YEATS domain-containing protein n=1 Tax=Menopon gallinae TaxID=328185 RepID=A0AAW2HLE3_9NEOP